MSQTERRAVAALLRDELARGWIPSRADLDAVLMLVRTCGSEQLLGS